MNIETIRIKSRRLKAAGATTEKVIAYLREQGCSKTLSIVIIADVYGYDMANAKRKVHFGQTWADTRESDEKWQKHLDSCD